jgi:hypothetical protein
VEDESLATILGPDFHGDDAGKSALYNSQSNVGYNSIARSALTWVLTQPCKVPSWGARRCQWRRQPFVESVLTTPC